MALQQLPRIRNTTAGLARQTDHDSQINDDRGSGGGMSGGGMGSGDDDKLKLKLNGGGLSATTAGSTPSSAGLASGLFDWDRGSSPAPLSASTHSPLGVWSPVRASFSPFTSSAPPHHHSHSGSANACAVPASIVSSGADSRPSWQAAQLRHRLQAGSLLVPAPAARQPVPAAADAATTHTYQPSLAQPMQSSRLAAQTIAPFLVPQRASSLLPAPRLAGAGTGTGRRRDPSGRHHSGLTVNLDGAPEPQCHHHSPHLIDADDIDADTDTVTASPTPATRHQAAGCNTGSSSQASTTGRNSAATAFGTPATESSGVSTVETAASPTTTSPTGAHPHHHLHHTTSAFSWTATPLDDLNRKSGHLEHIQSQDGAGGRGPGGGQAKRLGACHQGKGGKGGPHLDWDSVGQLWANIRDHDHSEPGHNHVYSQFHHHLRGPVPTPHHRHSPHHSRSSHFENPHQHRQHQHLRSVSTGGQSDTGSLVGPGSRGAGSRSGSGSGSESLITPRSRSGVFAHLNRWSSSTTSSRASDLTARLGLVFGHRPNIDPSQKTTAAPPTPPTPPLPPRTHSSPTRLHKHHRPSTGSFDSRYSRHTPTNVGHSRSSSTSGGFGPSPMSPRPTVANRSVVSPASPSFKLPAIAPLPSLEREIGASGLTSEPDSLLTELGPPRLRNPFHTSAFQGARDGVRFWEEGEHEQFQKRRRGFPLHKQQPSLTFSQAATLVPPESDLSMPSYSTATSNMAGDPNVPPVSRRGHSRTRSSGGGKGGSGDTTASSLSAKSRERDRERSIVGKQPSQKAMLSKALSKAQQAVTLDNEQHFELARRAYTDAVGLLGHVLQRTSAGEDRRKLEAIASTYNSRIQDLDQLLPPAYDFEDNQLPPSPPNGMASAIDDRPPTTMYTTSSAGKSVAPEMVRDIARDRAASTASNSSQPMLQSAFSTRQRFNSNASDRQPPPPPSPRRLPPARPVSPTHRAPSRAIAAREPETSERGGSASRSTDYSRLSVSGSPGGPRHRRAQSHESTSWLDPIDESERSEAASSVHSQTSFMAFRRKHIRAAASQDSAEAAFDAALDDAIEAAYDDGYEPEPISPRTTSAYSRMGNRQQNQAIMTDYDEETRRTTVSSGSLSHMQDEEAVSSTMRRVQLARELVRESERETVELANEQERKLRMQPQVAEEEEEERASGQPRHMAFHQAAPGYMGFYGDGEEEEEKEGEGGEKEEEEEEEEEEERQYDEMTRDCDANLRYGSSAYGGPSRQAAVPRESDSSGVTSRTSHGSMGSNPPTGTTGLTAASENGTLTYNYDRKMSTPSVAQPPSEALPQLPPKSPTQSVRNRRLSGQKAKQLKIETSRLTPAQGSGSAISPQSRQGSYIAQQRQALSTGGATRASGPPSAAGSHGGVSPVPPGVAVGEAFFFGGATAPTSVNPTWNAQQDEGEPRSPSPSANPATGRPPLGTNFSSSLGGANPAAMVPPYKTRNLSAVSAMDDTASDKSPLTPVGGQPPHLPGPPSARLPSVSTSATAGSLQDRMNSTATGGLYLFDDDFHQNQLTVQPNPASSRHSHLSQTASLIPAGMPGHEDQPPVSLEPCPTDSNLRPFWLMRCLYQTLCHPRGGYLSHKLFVPRDVWRVRGVKLRAVDDKVAQCDLLTAALQRLERVDTYNADAVLDEMQAFEAVLEQVQVALTRRLGSADVGVAGAAASLFSKKEREREREREREAAAAAATETFGEGTDGAPSGTIKPPSRRASLSGGGGGGGSVAGGNGGGGGGGFSWRRLRNKNSSANLTSAHGGKGGAAGGAAGSGGANGGNGATPLVEGGAAAMMMGSLPMTAHLTGRPVKRDVGAVVFGGPNATYMASLARLCDAAQVVDQIARQVEDPGLRHADKTQVGLELCTRHAAEFFGFYICRFVLIDLGLMLDKFVKRGTEWVLG